MNRRFLAFALFVICFLVAIICAYVCGGIAERAQHGPWCLAFTIHPSGVIATEHYGQLNDLPKVTIGTRDIDANVAHNVLTEPSGQVITVSIVGNYETIK